MITQNDSIVHPQMRRFALFVAILVGIIKGLEVLTPMAHGDALYYHLPLAKLWLESGFMSMHRELCGSLQAGIFDYFYIIPISILGNTLWAQIFAQAMYFLSGIGLAFFVIFKKVKPNVIVTCFVIIFAMTFAVDSDFFIFAKNDGVLASLGFLATLEFVENFFSSKFKMKSDLIFKGILLGLLPLIKINGIIISAILGIFYIIDRKKIIPSLKIALIAFVFMSPILLRNYYFIQSPFFPALLKIFPGTLNEAMIGFYTSALTAKISLHSLYFHLKAFLAFKVVCLFILLVSFKRMKYDFILIKYILISLFIFLFYLLVNGGVEASRFYFICYFINSYILINLLNQRQISTWFYICLLILTLSDSKIDKAIGRIYKFGYNILHSSNLNELTNKSVTLTKLWNFILPNSKIVTDDFSQVFYAPSGTRVYQYQCNQEAYFLNNCQSDEDVQKLNSFDYVILSDLKKTNNKCTDYIKLKFSEVHREGQYHLYKVKI